MPDRDRLRYHATLVDDMANSLGIDLEEAAICGAFRMEEISDAVLRCAGCVYPVKCSHWRAQHPKGAKKAPDYCRNREVLQALRP